jgi:hypothetical protein
VQKPDLTGDIKENESHFTPEGVTWRLPMRTRLGLIIVLAALALIFAGCDNDNNNKDLLFNGSDAFIQRVYIGNVPIQAGGTFNVPLSYTTRMRVELSNPVTRASLAELFHVAFVVTNLDTGDAYHLSECNMPGNGELFWPDDTNKVIEYRMTHAMDRVVIGGDSYSIGSPGDTLEVRILIAVGKAQDGTQFGLTMDEFFIVYTGSNQSL